MAFWAIWWTIYQFCLFLIVLVNTQNICDTCDCSISEESSDVRAVRYVKPVCNDGSFRWYNIYGGALRINFKPRFRGDFQLCFILETENVRVQVSEEISEESSSSGALSRPPILKPVIAAHGRTNEKCIQSSSYSIHLFLEPERTVDSKGFSFIVLKYVMEKRNDILVYDSMEECRPCTDLELVTAFCSHDVVIVGSMINVTHIDDRSQTDINIKVSNVIRRWTLNLGGPTKGPYILETMTRHRQCNVDYGPGVFLFTGKWRLGELKLTCSPYYHDWKLALSRAINSGDMLCSPN